MYGNIAEFHTGLERLRVKQSYSLGASCTSDYMYYEYDCLFLSEPHLWMTREISG